MSEKSSIEFPKIEQSSHKPSLRQLLPGGKSEVGFLENGQTLDKVLERDKKALEVMGYTAQEIADLLKPLLVKAGRALGSRSDGCFPQFKYISPAGMEYDVEVLSHRGYQECPWPDCKEGKSSRAGGGMILRFYKTGEEDRKKGVQIAGLIKHLVEAHGFFEGGSFRVAPEKIVEMLGTEKVPGSLKETNELKF